ncbi:serine/threonine-protein kinase [Archangium lansingense]|uniref:Serine/threonine-protein kinase n=1 Tax=Archangium lansingense TaxID=2995310 RepID=A0ABT3ZWS7_9BACT|nr:serine/threonine-protein kinase [Archangium lansinium]MCY1073781.1 serine/threonine-protein kinase [Archangium lansinium]
MYCENCSSEHPASLSCDEQDTWTGAESSDSVPRTIPALFDLRGRTLGHYRLTHLLGSGGMGTVYLAEQTIIGARVAVKVLHPNLAQDARLRARFYAEARTVNLIGHPNIVRIFDINESEDGLHYFVMEYLDGTPLSRLPRPTEPGLVAWLLAQACDALEAVHRSGVVHRDLKPDNLLMVQRPGERPTLKVLDFGVAKALHDTGNQEQTMAGQVFGTPAYMAPEQWAGQPVDGRADVYSLGVTGYLLVTGQLPYPRGQLAELVLSPEPPPPLRAPHELAPAVPEALSRALLRALARSSSERFANALEFKKALLAAVQPAPRPQASHATALAQTPRARAATPIPAIPTPPDPNDPTPPPTWTARVRRSQDSGSVVVHCSELSRGGLFMCCAEPFPQIFTRLEFTLLIGGEEVECVGEVVRHVDSAQARAWRMSPGVGLQFVNPSPRLRELLMRLHPSHRQSAASQQAGVKEALALI